MVKVNILEKFNKNKNRRFVDGFGMGESYSNGIIYTEVVGDRVYKVTQNGIFRFYKDLIDTDGSNVEKNNNHFELLVPKIPYKYYEMMIDWYRDVYKKQGTEACLLFYWNEDELEIPEDLYEENKDGLIIDGKLIIICPKQWNHGTVSKYTEETFDTGRRVANLPPMIRWLENNTMCYMETHSHHMMGAFWSGEDDANERGRALRMYSVYGRIMDENHQYEIRIGMLGDFYKMNLDSVFELPVERQTITTKETTITEETEVDRVIRKVNKTIHEETILNEYGFDLPEISVVEDIDAETGTKTTTIVDYVEVDTKVKPLEKTIVENNIETKVVENRFPESWWNMYNKIGGFTSYTNTKHTNTPITNATTNKLSAEDYLDLLEEPIVLDSEDNDVGFDLGILDDSDIQEDFDNFSKQTL